MKEDKFLKTQTERPDKATLGAMLGVLLLFAGCYLGLWAYGSYEHSLRSSDQAEHFRQHPEEFTRDRISQEEAVANNQWVADSEWRKAIWGGAISLIILSGAGFLFVRAVKIYRRMKRNEYEEIDWRALEKPARPVEIRATHYQNALAIGLIAFFGLTTVFNLSHMFGSPYETTSNIIYKSVLYLNLMLPLISALIFIVIQARRKNVRVFDASGITRGDGRHFLWSDFRGTIPRVGTFRYGGRQHYRTELMFANGGEVWVLPQHIKNLEEVDAIVNRLPRAVLKDTK